MANWVPSVDDTSEIIGIFLLFLPYLIILLPFLQERIVKFFQTAYLHRTPRDEWNPAVDHHPPRRLLGYLFSIIFTFTSIALILINNHYNNYWVDFAQYFVYLSLPLTLSIVRPPSHRPCDIFDVLIIVCVILPIELSQEFDAFLPDLKFSIYPSWGMSPHISILRFCGFNLFLFIFFIFRPLDNIGLHWNAIKNQRNKLSALLFIIIRFASILCIFLMLAVPFCLIPAINYLNASQKLSNQWIGGWSRYFCLFFLEILIYEFLYRGIIQNLIHSAFDFRTEARQYLRGREDSVTSMPGQFEMGFAPQKNVNHKEANGINIELLWKSKKKPLVEDDTDTKYIDMDSEDTMSLNTIYSDSQYKRDTLQCSHGYFCYFLRFNNARDWLCVLFASVIYGLTVIDYRNFDDSRDLIYAFLLMTYLGFCGGWLYRLTRSCFVSAVFNSLVIFCFKYIFNPDGNFCNGACQ